MDQPQFVLISSNIYIQVHHMHRLTSLGQITCRRESKASACSGAESAERDHDATRRARRAQAWRIACGARRARRDGVAQRGACRAQVVTQVCFNTPPQSQLLAPMQRLERKSSNSDVGNPLVKTSANCFALGIWRMRSSPTPTFLRTKWISSSMCLVRR